MISKYFPLVLLLSLDAKMAFHTVKLEILHDSGGGKKLTIKCALKLNVTCMFNIQEEGNSSLTRGENAVVDTDGGKNS